MKKTLLITGGVLMLTAALVVAFSGQLNIMSDETRSYQVGEAIQIGDATMLVNEVEVMTATDNASLREGEISVNLNLVFENDGGEDRYIVTPAMMYVLDEDENQYRPRARAVNLEGDAERVDGPLPAGSQRTGWISFAVEEDANGLFMRYWPDALGVSDTEIKVDLGL